MGFLALSVLLFRLRLQAIDILRKLKFKYVSYFQITFVFTNMSKNIEEGEDTEDGAGKLLEDEEKEKKVKKNRLDATCPICYTILIDKFSRDRHVRLVHTQRAKSSKVDISLPTTQVKCPKCDKAFKHKVSLKRHMNIHDRQIEDVHGKILDEDSNVSISKSGGKFQCPRCEKSFIYDAFLKKHIKKHDEELQGFSCDQCNQFFGRKDNLYKHMARVHGILNKNFDAMIPTAGDKFVCQMCKADFESDKEKFKVHIMSKVCQVIDSSIKINDDKKYQCELCDKSYLEKDSLDRHMQYKHRKKPTKFKCEVCESTFSYESSLVRHIKKKHTENTGS